MPGDCTPPRRCDVHTLLDRAALLDRPHLVAAPNEVATEPASHPEQRQQNVAQQEGERGSHAEVPCGRARERGRGRASRRTPRNRALDRRNAQARPDRRPAAAGRGAGQRNSGVSALAGEGAAALPLRAMQPSPASILPTAADVDAAARRLAGIALHTPLVTSPVLDALPGARVL